MRILKKVNEFIMWLSILAMIFWGGCCLDSEGFVGLRIEAAILVVVAGTMIMYYSLEKEEEK